MRGELEVRSSLRLRSGDLIFAQLWVQRNYRDRITAGFGFPLINLMNICAIHLVFICKFVKT